LFGRVTDSTDAVLPGVTVTAVHVDTGNTFTGVTDLVGTYQMTAVRPGAYRISVELSGFASVLFRSMMLEFPAVGARRPSAIRVLP
jgi:carboxypeptidase family protein